MSLGFEFNGPAGRLEALLDPAAANISLTKPAGAVVCHPHPLRGGTMHNTVVYRTAKGLSALGMDVLRFNFRGVGASAGTHDEGPGEREDARAALDALAARGCSTLIGVGYSFGGAQMLQIGMGDSRVAALVAIGLPVKMYDLAFARHITKPLLVVQGEEDVFGAPADVRAFFVNMPNVEIAAIDGAGHFFEGKAHLVAQAAADFAKKYI